MFRHVSFAIATAVAVTVAGTAGSGTSDSRLEVVVTDLRSDAGRVHIALYDRQEAFPKSKGMWSQVRVAVEDQKARHVFESLTTGRYAVAVFHDENGNGKFDQGIFGIPLEGFAFSRGARPFFGPPRFESAAFEVTGDGSAVTVRMRY